MLRKLLCILVLTVLAAAAFPAEAEAQRRAVRRRPVGRSAVYVPARAYYPAYYYRPFYPRWYGGFYSAGWYGWGGWYPYYGWSPYGYYQHYPPFAYRYDNSGAARIEVKPRDAEVYVDGYLVGTVDDFDGWLQRLHVVPGEHELVIYKPGFRTYRERVLFRPGATLKIEHALEPLPAGETADERPTPSTRSRPTDESEYTGPARRRGTFPPPAPRDEAQNRDDRGGAVAIRVQPADAEVRIDGERWDSPQGSERLVVQLTEGEHRIEIRREGYAPFTTTVRVKRGETAPLNVSLTRQ